MLSEEKDTTKGPNSAGGILGMLGGKEKIEAVKNIQVTFEDVKGIDEFKDELEDIVDFLKHPKKYAKAGAKIPRGVLLCGEPGTGKTLLGKAVAGEAHVPFYYKSGSEFDEIFVGLGASRVRNMFNEARENAPSIIFIDEIDAVAGKRQFDQTHSKDTLNQILCEMDGFESDDQVIVIAATNLEESLDKAIKRPGRFDKIVHIPLPDIKGREQIFKHYLKEISYSNIDAEILAKQTTGFTGADIKNMVNTAILIAIKQGKKSANKQDFEEAIDRITMGISRKSAIISPKDKFTTAYHEGGHALCSLLTRGSTPLNKVTILQRGQALGFTSFLPKEDNKNESKRNMLANIDCLLAGRVGEEILLGIDDVTTGCHDDLRKATQLAYAFLRQVAFNEKVNWITGPKSTQSDRFNYEIDMEVQKILKKSYKRVKNLLTKNKKLLEILANKLVEKEVLSANEINILLNLKKKDIKGKTWKK